MKARRCAIEKFCTAVSLALTFVSAALGDDGKEYFESKVRPILVERCQTCHGAVKPKAELRLDGREGYLAAREAELIVPGNPDESRLIEAIRYGDPTLQMPPKSKLPQAEIEILEHWVRQGASWPATKETAQSGAGPSSGSSLEPAEYERRAQHWSFQPLARSLPPDAADQGWSRNPLDRFLVARQLEVGLHPVADAERASWCRRVTLDLTGLPPRPEELDAFVSDDRLAVEQRLVDRLLASPRYGERWGRHWLDLVRYAETAGHEFDYDIPNAYRYRDYVVRAFNADVPFDLFAREQIAGDILPKPRLDAASGWNESLQGTGFWLVGEGTHSPVDVRAEQVRRIDNQIDVLGKTFLGLTIACARCHDHKFDPLTQQDYYGLAGFLKSSRHGQAPVDADCPRDPPFAELMRLHREIASRVPCPEAAGPNDNSVTGGSATTNYRFINRDDRSNWSTLGPAFEEGSITEPRFRIRGAKDPIAGEWLPFGLAHSGRLSDRLCGTLSSPTFTIDSRFLHIRCWGRGGRVNVVVDGFEKIRDPIYGGLTFAVDSGDDPRWFRVDLAMWRGHRAYVEFADGMTIDFTSARSLVREGAGFLALDVLCTSDHAEPPKGFTATPLLVPRGSLSTEIRSLLQAYAAKEAELAVPPLAPVLVDGTGENERLLRRGNPASPLAEVPRRAPQILAGTPIDEGESRGSGRLQLAFALVHSRAALPARVVVNRLWHHHFGRGLVPTTDDFGHMGEPPSHPELLDYLAGELISHQWSLKHVHRLMIMSHAYRLATEGQTNDPEIDPTNRLLAHYPIRRFEAEAIRDSVLAISGRLDERLGGPSVPIHLTPYMDGRGRPPESGPLDGDGRRSLYLSARRNFPNFLLAVFDLPPNTSTVGRRNTTNVPAQALALWNDPFILAEANRWGRSMAAQASESMESRIESMFLQAFARRPNVHELEAAWQLLRKGPNQGDAWGELAHVLFNSKEFVYLD